MLNPVWLNTFKTLIDVGHFTKTAEQLFMTQPGVSQHIKRLEEACGYALIRRDKKSFELTEQGRMVYQYAIQLQQGESQLLERLGFDDPFAGRCTLACSGSLALRLYPKLLALQSCHRDLVIELEAAPNDKILRQVQAGEIDLGIVTQVTDPGVYDAEVIGRENLCLVLPANVEIQGDIAATLADLGLISHPDAESYFALYCSRCGDAGLNALSIADIPIRGYINQLSQILLPVAQGLGFSVLPASAVESFPQRGQLQLYQPVNAVQETLYRVTRRHWQCPARYKTLDSTLRAVVEA